jgi:recombination protein RecA
MAKKKKEEVEVQKHKSDILNTVIAQLQKKFGEATIKWLGDSKVVEHTIVPTGCLSLDAALGVGGIALGRVYELYGAESSGKSTIAYSILSQAKKMGLRAAYIDAEHTLDLRLVEKMGVDKSSTVLVRGYTGEQNLDIAEALIGSGEISICVIDSVAALLPTSEANLESFEDQQMGTHARLISKMCRNLVPLCAKTNTALILINQVRNKIGSYGDPEVTTGGNSIKFYASARIRVSGGTKASLVLGPDGLAIGHTLKFEIKKNKLAAPFRSGEADIIYGEGFDPAVEAIVLGEEMGLVDRSGAWFNYGETLLGQGKENSAKFLKANPHLLEEITLKIRETIGIASSKVFVPEIDDVEEETEPEDE